MGEDLELGRDFHDTLEHDHLARINRSIDRLSQTLDAEARTTNEGEIEAYLVIHKRMLKLIARLEFLDDIELKG